MSNFFLSPEYQQFARSYAANMGKLDSFRTDDPSEDTKAAREDSEANLDAVKATYANAWRRDDEPGQALNLRSDEDRIEDVKRSYQDAWKGDEQSPRRNISATRCDSISDYLSESKLDRPRRNIAVSGRPMPDRNP